MKPILRVAVVFGSLSAHAAWAQTTTTPAPAPPAPAAGGGNATSSPPPPAAPAPAPTVTPAAPAPVPPPTINLTPTAPAPAPASRSGSPDTGVGLSPSAPAIGGGTNLSNKEAATLTPSTGGTADEWKFDFHGYLRAPLRVSFGPATPLQQPSINNAPDSYLPGSPPPVTGFQAHSTPRVPGMLYTTWEYTNTVSGPWSQLNFSYGNSKVTATVIVDAYNQTDGGYRNLQAQQGIDQAFVTLNFPDLFNDYGGLVWNVGSFQNRYGAAGKYDGGMYETYLFGRTHQSGETLTATFSNLDARGDWTFTLEHGIGTKMDVVPFLNNANYQVFQNVPIGGNMGSPYLSDRTADYLPYAGAVPLGSTFVNHVHVGAKYQKTWTFGAHYIYVWTPDDNWSPRNSTQLDVSDSVPRSQGPIQGSMAIVGPEVRFDGGAYGYGYLGWSHIDARNINALADILEVLHSYGGSQFKQNYFGQTFNQHTGVYNGPENETGTVDNIMAQYTFSLGAWNRAPEDWWGDGPDLVLTAFGLLSNRRQQGAAHRRRAGRLARHHLGHEHQEAEVRPRRPLHAVLLVRDRRPLRHGDAGSRQRLRAHPRQPGRQQPRLRRAHGQGDHQDRLRDPRVGHADVPALPPRRQRVRALSLPVVAQGGRRPRVYLRHDVVVRSRP